MKESVLSETLVDPEKLKEAVWFIVSHCSPKGLRIAKLQNILYYADMELFHREGRPLLTDVDHIERGKRSPVIEYIESAVSELSANGAISVAGRDRYTSTKDFKKGRLTDNEIALLTEITHNEIAAVDPEKLKEAVWFIVSYYPPEELENIKLHKILYYADMELYYRERRPLLTDVDHIERGELSPVIEYLASAVSDLVANRTISIAAKNHYTLMRDFKKGLLTDREIKLLTEIADSVRSGML
jgi:uncharacterized phage-associated protein